MHRTALYVFLILLSGCMVGPNYRRPYVEIPCGWNTTLEEFSTSSNLAWWSEFNDPVLDELIKIALQENQDLRLATARVDEFLGLYRVSYSDLLPRVEGEGSYHREKISEKVTPSAPGVKNPDNIYRAFLKGSWELDLWGKIRRATEAACAELLASEEARLSVIQTLVSAVASTYIDILRLDRQLEISIHTANTRRDTLDLFQKRFEAGVISKIDLSQIESEYQDALATIPEFQREIGQLEHALSVLLGRNPGPIRRGKVILDLTLPGVPSGLPSDLLTQRPDIREAEDVLRAANARIGVARAAYFPSVSLTGEYGNASRELNDLFKGDAKAWNIFSPVSIPIFTAGQIAGEVKAAEAVKCQAIAVYRQKILIAFREVEDALVFLKKIQEQVEVQRKQVEALQTYARLARLRYDEGYASYLEVLDSERSLFNVQLDYTETYANLYQAMVSLYKALGGGWICKADRSSF